MSETLNLTGAVLGLSSVAAESQLMCIRICRIPFPVTPMNHLTDLHQNRRHIL